MSSSRSAPKSRVEEIQRTLRHALATQRTETDSWLNGYQQDVAWLLAELELVEGALHDLMAEVHAVGSSMVGRVTQERSTDRDLPTPPVACPPPEEEK